VVRADIVVSNADLPYTYRQLLNGHGKKDYPESKLDRMDYACSGYILYLGVDREYPHMQHQSIYFSEDYRANLDAIAQLQKEKFQGKIAATAIFPDQVEDLTALGVESYYVFAEAGSGFAQHAWERFREPAITPPAAALQSPRTES
jgi:hypothetical protein